MIPYSLKEQDSTPPRGSPGKSYSVSPEVMSLMENILALTVNRLNGSARKIRFRVQRLFNAGWAGSDRNAIDHHISELAALGVPAPKHVPTLFALGNHLLTTSRSIQVHGDSTSGEVEYVILKHRGELLVTVGSDHTDRRLETHSIPKAKNMCLNVMASEVWPYEEVRSHFDRLELACWVERGGEMALYQRDVCSALLPPAYWIKEISARVGAFSDRAVLFSGTIGTVSGLVVGDAYEFRLTDPVLARTITHRYDCHVLTGAIEDY